MQRFRHISTVFTLSVLGFAGALVMQHYLGLDPCPLCILQRYALLGVVILSGWATFAPRQLFRTKLALGGTSALAGAGIAGWQIHLQAAADSVTSGGGCGASLAMMVDALPMSQLLPAIFAGEASCTVAHHVLGLTVPQWSLALFAGLLGICIWVARGRASQPHK